MFIIILFTLGTTLLLYVDVILVKISTTKCLSRLLHVHCDLKSVVKSSIHPPPPRARAMASGCSPLLDVDELGQAWRQGGWSVGCSALSVGCCLSLLLLVARDPALRLAPHRVIPFRSALTAAQSSVFLLASAPQAPWASAEEVEGPGGPVLSLDVESDERRRLRGAYDWLGCAIALSQL